MPAVGPINPASITPGAGSITSGVTSGVGALNPGAGLFPGNTDLSVSGTVGIITNAVPIEGLYDGATNAVTNTLRQTGIGNPKDPLGKGGTQARPSRVPPAGERRFVSFEVLVALPSNLTQQALDALARRHRVARLESQAMGLTGTTLHRWQITDQRAVADVVRALEADLACARRSRTTASRCSRRKTVPAAIIKAAAAGGAPAR